MKKYTEEEQQFFREYIPGHHSQETADEFNKRFGKSITANQVRYYRHNNKIRTGFKGAEGIVSKYKGKERPKYVQEAMKATQFKKGCAPSNKVPLYTIRDYAKGYRKIKVKEPSGWIMYSRYIWEKEYGPLPKGKYLIHLNGNIKDDDLENLMPVTRQELARINQKGIISTDREVTKTAINIIRLENMIREKEKKLCQKK